MLTVEPGFWEGLEKRLRDRLPAGYRCPTCGQSNSLVFERGLVEAPIIAADFPVKPGDAVVTVTLTCAFCGNTQFFNIRRLGAQQDQGGPESGTVGPATGAWTLGG